MMIDDLMKMTVGDLLENYCVVYSPECGYYYGVALWDDVGSIFDEFDLEEEYCFQGDSLIPIEYFDCGDSVLSLSDLKMLMDKLGILKKEPCPSCESDNYHFDYNKSCKVCADCRYNGEKI